MSFARMWRTWYKTKWRHTQTTKSHTPNIKSL